MPDETAEGLVLLALGLQAPDNPTPQESAELALARHVLGRAAAASAQSSPTTPGLADALTGAVIAGSSISGVLNAAVHHAATATQASWPESLQDHLERLVTNAPPVPASELDALTDFDLAIRRTAVRTSASPLSVPQHVAGRALDRTLGPFLDATGQPLWIDLFRRISQIAVIRSPETVPFLIVPLRGLLQGAATYSLPAGSVWILARLLAPDAPPGGYCGIRIKAGTLTLSAAATVAGGTLQIGAGVVVTLDIETDPVIAPASAGELGLDGDGVTCLPPAKARLTVSPSQALLDGADDAELTAYGTSVSLHQSGSAGRMEPLVNRVWLPMRVDDGVGFGIRRVRSQLFRPTGEAELAEGAWVFAVTVPDSPSSLGPAEGAGALALRVSAGIRASWRGLAGDPVRLAETVVLAEPGRLTVAGLRTPGTAWQSLRLWDQPGTGPRSGSQVTLGFSLPQQVQFVSEAAAGDVLQTTASLDASLDRPLGADGRRFPLRAAAAAVLLSQEAAGFRALLQADLTAQPPSTSYSGPGSLALTNALVRLSPPAGLLISGSWDTPDQIRGGTAAVDFGVRAIIPALRDPYVSNFALPLRRGNDFTHLGAAGAAGTAGRLIAAVTWSAPHAAELRLLLPPVPVGSLLDVLPEEIKPDKPFGHVADEVAKAQAADADADRAMRQLFQRTAGPVQERLLLLDVSSNIDQFGIGFGLSARDDHVEQPQGSAGPLQIVGLDLSAPARNLRVLLLPQVQWEPIVNLPNPLVGPFPDRMASADDGGATALGTQSITLVPIAPERLASTMLEEFNSAPATALAAKFTLPFGMKAVARFQPDDGSALAWAVLSFHQPATADGRFAGGLQIQAESQPDRGRTVESPSFPGAAWQTSNGIDPGTGTPFGLSALSASFGNPGVQQFFNDEMGPFGSRPRVPVTRVEFSGYGGSYFSAWGNPNAVAATSQVRFDVLAGRTAYEVVQVASILLPWGAPVVRTITLERRKEGMVLRFDSGWVATAPGLYRYPAHDPAVPLPAGWSPIETHPGLVRGAWNIRRIRETNRVVARDFPPVGPRPAIRVELLEVRFDADFDIEGVVKGNNLEGLVPSRDQVGFVQRLPQGYPLLPEQFAAILLDEGPVGGPVDCVVDIAGSGQRLQVARVDVAPAPAPLGGPPHFAAAARGALALPNDGDWSAVRHSVAVPEPQPVDAHSGVPLVRSGTASGSIAPSSSYRIAEPSDLLREDTPDVEFGLIQGSDGHRVLFSRPRIVAGTAQWSSTERPILADTYTLSIGVGLVPPEPACFVGEAPWGLAIDGASGRYTLLPASTMRFNAPPAVADRRLVDTAPFKIRTRYENDMRFTLDPTQPQPWKVECASIFTTMDLGPFSELLGVRHGFRVGAGEAPSFVQPKTIYPPPLQPVVAVLEFLASLLGLDELMGIEGHQGSFNFKASLTLNIVNPRSADGFIDFGGFEIKGKLALGIASAPHWNGFLKIALGSRVPVLPPIFGGGEISVGLEGTALAEQKVEIEVRWSASVGKRLGPLELKATFSFGIQVITSNTGSWQIGVLIGIAGSADVWIVKVSVRIELLAAIKILTAAESPPSGAKQAIGQAKFAFDVTIAVFVTITIEVSVQVTETLHI